MVAAWLSCLRMQGVLKRGSDGWPFCMASAQPMSAGYSEHMVFEGGVDQLWQPADFHASGLTSTQLNGDLSDAHMLVVPLPHIHEGLSCHGQGMRVLPGLPYISERNAVVALRSGPCGILMIRLKPMHCCTGIGKLLLCQLEHTGPIRMDELLIQTGSRIALKSIIRSLVIQDRPFDGPCRKIAASSLVKLAAGRVSCRGSCHLAVHAHFGIDCTTV